MKLGELVCIRTGRLDANQAVENGRYPFFTCAADPLRIDAWQYDCECVLVAGNCNPYVSYYNGKFNAYQRVYIIEVQEEDRLYAKYLYYFLKLYMERSTDRQHGAIEKFFHLSDFTEIDIDFPSVEEQRLVADSLWTIDRKIALNRKRIATLEAMAKEIYDYWFVQFDFPDAHGRPYKSSGGAMVYNPDLKREIPKGWCCDNLLRISKLIAGGTPRKDRQEYWNGTIPFFGPTDAAGDIFQLKTADTVTQEGLDHSAGALMSENTVIITARGSIGKMVVCGVPMTMNQSCFAFEEVAGRYEYLYFKVKELIQYLLLKGNGTTFKSIVTIDIENSILCLADDATIDRFTDRVRPLFAGIKNATKEIEKLSSLRDFLLPLLMNGQVKVG